MTEHMPDNCKHEWTTKYSTRLDINGVEWFCSQCHKNLDWPTAKKWVNTHTDLLEALIVAKAIINKDIDLTNDDYNQIEQAIRKAEEQIR